MTDAPRPPFILKWCITALCSYPINSWNHTIAFIHLHVASRLRGKEKKVKSVPPPPPPRPNTKAKSSGAADQEPAATIPKTIDARDDARDDSSIRSGLTEPSLSGSETSQKVPPPPPPRPTGSLATPSETHGSILLGEVLTHAETFVKGVVLLQAIFRGRKARKKYALMRYYRGLDKSPSSAKPTASIDDKSGKKEIQPVNTRSVFLSHSVPKTKATVQPTKATASAGNIIFGPRSSATPVVASAIPTSTPSNPDPPSSPNKNPPVSAHPSATPVVASAIPTSTTSRSEPPSPPNKNPPVSAHPLFTPRGGAILQSARELLPQLEDQVRLRKEAEEKKKAAKEEKKAAARSVDFSPLERSMKTIEVTVFGSEEASIEVIEGAVFDPKESKEAQQCAAAAKKVLLRHTNDYIAYLNALLKAHANEGILSINEGIDAIVNELLCFLAMKALGKGPVPSIKIHRAWRIMVQSRPFVYIEMCKAMGASSGFSVEDENFNPEEDGHSHEANVIKEKYEATKSAYTALFQSNPPAEFWPSIHSKDDKVSSIPANHLEFLREENLPQNNGDMLSEIGSDAMTSASDAMTSVSGMTYDDDSLGTLEPAALLNELQYLAEEQNIDIANLSYDSIVEDIKKMRVWVDKTFF